VIFTAPAAGRPGYRLIPSAPTSSTPGRAGGWGYGLLLNTADLPGMRRAGSGSWPFALYNSYEQALYAAL
jgi:hypothetical protein